MNNYVISILPQWRRAGDLQAAVQHSECEQFSGLPCVLPTHRPHDADAQPVTPYKGAPCRRKTDNRSGDLRLVAPIAVDILVRPVKRRVIWSTRMNRWLRMFVASGAVFVSAQAFGNSISHPLSPKHQLIACMTKQMSASKTISYNEATKVCKAQLKAQTPTLASTAVSGPVSGLGR
jgi:hypothetical protein